MATSRHLHRQTLKGERSADLSVQQVRKIELVMKLTTRKRARWTNLKTATAPGLTVPATLPARTDEVIE